MIQLLCQKLPNYVSPLNEHRQASVPVYCIDLPSIHLDRPTLTNWRAHRKQFIKLENAGHHTNKRLEKPEQRVANIVEIFMSTFPIILRASAYVSICGTA